VLLPGTERKHDYWGNMWITPTGFDDFLTPRVDTGNFDWADLESLFLPVDNQGTAGPVLHESSGPGANQKPSQGLTSQSHALERAAARPTAGSYASLVSVEGSPRSQVRADDAQPEGSGMDRRGFSPLSLEQVPWLAPTSPLLDELVSSAVAGVVEGDRSFSSAPLDSGASDGESRRSYTAASISCFSAENGRPCHGSGDVADGSEQARSLVPRVDSSSRVGGPWTAREHRYRAYIRYREKKRQRKCWKTVRYVCRKELAEARPRYKGRFVRKSELASCERERTAEAATCDGKPVSVEGIVPTDHS
jgi:hypothetical protein